MKAFTILVLFTLLSACNAAAFLGVGCPDDHKQGDTWNPPGCMECSCSGTTYACYGCGNEAFEIDMSKCYIEKSTSTSYPQCCEQNPFCEGDPGFNASKLIKPESKPTTTPRRPKTTTPRRRKTTKPAPNKPKP